MPPLQGGLNRQVEALQSMGDQVAALKQEVQQEVEAMKAAVADSLAAAQQAAAEQAAATEQVAAVKAETAALQQVGTARLLAAVTSPPAAAAMCYALPLSVPSCAACGSRHCSAEE
jgi:hypothetical protein